MLNRVAIATLLLANGAMALAQNAAPSAAGGEQVHTEATARFKQIDKNGDGKLSLEEFVNRPAGSNPTATPPKPDAKTIADRTARFKEGDTNHDGFLSLDEFKMLKNNPPASEGAKAAGTTGK